MRKIFITGGTGLVGSHLLYRLLQKEVEITALKRPSSNTEAVKKTFSYYTSDSETLFSKIQWVEADLLDPESISEALAASGCEEVFHCAAIVSFRSSDRRKLMENNITGTGNIVNASLETGIRKLCFVSSTAALGSASAGKEVTEENIWKPLTKRSAYALSKFRSEMEVWRGIAEGLPAVIVNPSIILGPGFWDRGSSSMFTAVYNGLKFYTNGITGYVDVLDVVEIMDRLMSSDITGERFIVSSENLSYRQIFTMIARALGLEPPKYNVSPAMGYLACAGSSLISLFTRKPPVITREMLEAAHTEVRFSPEKIIRQLSFQFTPISDTINFVAKCFLQDKLSAGM